MMSIWGSETSGAGMLTAASMMLMLLNGLLWATLWIDGLEHATDFDWTRIDDTRVNAGAPLVAPVEELHEVGNRVGGLVCVWIERDEAAAWIAFQDAYHGGRADTQVAAHPTVFRERRGQIQVEVGAEAPRVEQAA